MATTASSAIWPLNVALRERFLATPGIKALVGDKGVYYGKPSATGAAPPYIVLGNSTEGSFRTFGRKGKDGTEEVHIWSKQDKREVMTLYNEIDQALESPLLVDGHDVVRVQVEFVAYFVDPDDQSLHHGVARVGVLTRRKVAVP